MKKVLVTAGATMAPIDRVRAITNIFSGRTGAAIADFFVQMGWEVILLTSRPDLVENRDRLRIFRYRTFDELMRQMHYWLRSSVCGETMDAVIHSAAVGDYRVGGVYVKEANGQLVEIDSSAKISSSHSEIFLRLDQAPKIIDLIREPWGFKGTLVKFKLQVGISDEELIKVATASMHASRADFIVANCLEWMREYAYIIRASDNRAEKIRRVDLPRKIMKEVAV